MKILFVEALHQNGNGCHKVIRQDTKNLVKYSAYTSAEETLNAQALVRWAQTLKWKEEKLCLRQENVGNEKKYFNIHVFWILNEDGE